MESRQQEQMAKDIHLIAAPFRLVGDWVRIVLFILALPVVLVVRLLSGGRIMSDDECSLAEIVLTVLLPFTITLLYIAYTHIRENRNASYKRPVHELILFVLSFVALPFVARVLFLNGFYSSTNAAVATSPFWVPLGVFILALLSMPKSDQDEQLDRKIDASMKARALEEIQRIDSLRKVVCPYCQTLVPDNTCTYGLGNADLAKIARHHGQGCQWIAQGCKSRNRRYRITNYGVPGFPPEHPLAGKNENDYTVEQIVEICERAGYG